MRNSVWALRKEELSLGFPPCLTRSVMRLVNMVDQCTLAGQYEGRYGPFTLELLW
jgi:hypothetical protein